MKKLLIAASLAAMTLLPTVASAQPSAQFQPARYEQNHRNDRQVTVQRTTVRHYTVNGRRYEAQRGPAWNAPRSYRHQNWRRNDRLPVEYRRVVVRDYGRYHLPPPARGQQWVRVDNDVVLVSIASGLIGAVIAGAFSN